MLAMEEAVCPDIFFSGIDHIEKLEGGLIRIVLYAERKESDGTTLRIVVAKLIRPLSTLPAAMGLLSRAMGDADMPFVADGGKITPLN